MAKLNLQTWARITRLDLQEIAAAIGNQSLANLRSWPETGEGRAVKASTEKMIRNLDHTFESSDLHFIFDNMESVVHELEKISHNSFYKSHIMNENYQTRSGKQEVFSDSVGAKITSVREFIRTYRPKKSRYLVRAFQPGNWKLLT